MRNEDKEDDVYHDDDLGRPPIWYRVVATFDLALAIVGDAAGWLLETLEWALGVVAGRFAMLMPWRWLERGEQIDLSDNVDDELWEQSEAPSNPTVQRMNEIHYSIMDRFVGGVVIAFYFVWEGAGHIAERLVPRRLFWPLYWLADRLVFVADLSADFLGGWWFSRDLRKLLMSVPAILLAVILSGTATLGFFNSDAKKLKRYQIALEAAEEVNDADGVALLKQKLAQLGFERFDSVELSSAFELVKDAKYEEAYAKMCLLAPVEGPGILEAHLWIAHALLTERVQPEEDRWELLESHVEHALKLSDDTNAFARRCRVELMARSGELGDAIEQMESLTDQYPELHAVLAHEYSRQNDMQSARRHARRTVTYYEKMHKTRAAGIKSGDDLEMIFSDYSSRLLPTGCLRIAEAYRLVGDRQAEERVLHDAIARYPNDETLRSTLLKVKSSLLKELQLADKRCLPVMESICRIDREDKQVLQMLMAGLVAAEMQKPREESVEATDEVSGEASHPAWKIVRKLRANDLLSSRIFRVVGDYFLMNEEHEKAIEYYVRTCKLDPDESFAWNNLAAVWSSTDSGKLEEALKAANRAIQLNPDPRFYDTRGQIFVHLSRWEEAVQDLETAISGSIPNAADAHRSLIVAYGALGKAEQATAHRAMLESF